jgi:hypothetical protein
VTKSAAWGAIIRHNRGENMAYVRAKKIKRRSKRRTWRYRDAPEEYVYYQLVEGYRDESGKVKQRVLAHLGRDADPHRAIERWERCAENRRNHAADLRYAAMQMRERAHGDWRRGFNRGSRRGKWYVPRAGTDVPDIPPQPPGFAAPGWFYFEGETPEDAEQQAQEALAEAETYQRRANHTRAALIKSA